METYNADSFDGWLQGDSVGGYYETFLKDCPLSTVGVGIGSWPTATCGDHLCWSSKEESGAPRIHQMLKDQVPEIAMFRIYGPQETVPQDQRWPQAWWWPLLTEYGQGLQGEYIHVNSTETESVL